MESVHSVAGPMSEDLGTIVSDCDLIFSSISNKEAARREAFTKEYAISELCLVLAILPQRCVVPDYLLTL